VSDTGTWRRRVLRTRLARAVCGRVLRTRLARTACGLLSRRPSTRSGDILDAYVSESPSAERAFGLFAGEWSSEIPGYGFGQAKLFDDYRIRWVEEQCGGLKGKRILELGPLEGGHTYMMARAGAASITSIEANTRAFLKCLVVQNALKFEADFRLGDFRRYLANNAEVYDLLLASGDRTGAFAQRCGAGV
jgi:hypothetical protein